MIFLAQHGQSEVGPSPPQPSYRFEIKLYGPYGEEEVHHKNIRINGTQLKQSEYGFDSYILDAGNKLLGGINGKAESFNPDTFGLSWIMA